MGYKNQKIIGIQGGEGSYNHQAAVENCPGRGRIEYLYNTRAVLEAVESKRVDYGQFALVNTLGGTVGETMEEIGRHRFAVIDSYRMQIRHCLMARKGVTKRLIGKIMSHEQALKQCARNLEKYYGWCQAIAGSGDLADTAQIAKALAEGRLASDTAVVGSKNLASIYGLDILQSNLQDHDNNYTTFLLVAANH